VKDVKGKTAFVTGGGSGIGLGIARALQRAGMDVVIADVRADHLETAQMGLEPAATLALELDVTDRAAFARAADAAEARFGRIHVLVNNAGVAVVGPVELASYGDWDWTLSVNLGGTINGLVTVLPRILAHGEGGHIVCTASMSGLLPHPGAAIYATSKAAVIGLCEAIRAELEPRGVVVSAFCPGPVQSNIPEAGKTRPEKFRDTGYAETDRRRQQGASYNHLYQTADRVGERVLAGILADELYILTHPEFAAGVRSRAAAMVAAVPAGAENAALKEAFPQLFDNPIYAQERARHERLD
jgi:NAD(P)-dependent dehydrogenase (short-subunit alcohol dehydrogenase family)